MKFAIVGNNKHQKPTKGAKGVCPVCGEEVLAKCGKIKAHYWSHLADSKCVYKGNKGEWHIAWQNEFPDDWQEVLLINTENNERNLADVRTPNGLILEFQHSHIKDEEKTARELFYKNMCWVVDGTNWSKIRTYFENKYKDASEEEIEKRVGIDKYDYEMIFSAVWASSSVPIFYDFYGQNTSEERTRWQEYLYCCFPYRDWVGFYAVPIKRQNFIKIAREDRLQKMMHDIQRSIDKKSRQKQESIDRKEQKRQKRLQKQREEKQKQKEITRQNARLKEALLKGFFDAVKQQNQFVHPFYDRSDTLIAKLNFTNGLKRHFLEDVYNPQYKQYNSNDWIECTDNAYLCVDNEDIKNCNIRNFTCCPKGGQKLNDYYKNISKNTVFFAGEIGKEGAKRAFAGFPRVIFVDKGSKTMSVLCKNFLNGREQNSFSIVHVVFVDGIYYHYQYYSTKHIEIFLKMVCNNNSITVQDIKFL